MQDLCWEEAFKSKDRFSSIIHRYKWCDFDMKDFFRFSLHENSFYDGIIFVASNFKRMMHVSYLHRFCNILLGWILKALKNWREYTKIFFFKAEKARGLVYQMHKKRIKAFKSRATSMSFLIKRGIPSALFKLNATRATTLWDDVERTMLVLLLYLPYS